MKQANRTLDDRDRKLLGLLKADARMPVAELARRLNLSRTAIQQRMKRLEETGIIVAYTINTAPLGSVSDVRAIMQLQFTRQHCPEVAEELRGWPEILSCWSFAGEEDMGLFVSVPTTAALMDLVKRLSKIPLVARTKMHVVLETHFDRPREPD